MSAMRLSGRSYNSLTVAGYPPFKIAPTAAAGLRSGSVVPQLPEIADKTGEKPLALGRQQRHRLGVSSDSSGWSLLRLSAEKPPPPLLVRRRARAARVVATTLRRAG